ncbi:MAG: FHA domain-containing protein [Clostridiales bacterium]|nr:FHA domain-containing protein [Clostridiales bacterium]
MGLQKGQSGYAFRWLIPIFSLLEALMLCVNSIVLTVVAVGTGSTLDFASMYNKYSGYLYGISWFSVMDKVQTALNMYTAYAWLIAIMMLALAILAFVMNKKGSYIFGIIGGGLCGLTHLIKMILWFYVKKYVPLTLVTLIGVYALVIAAFAICICVFSAVSLPKCQFERTPNDRQMAGQNLTYVGFEQDNDPYASRYHDNYEGGRVDPYAPEVIPEPEPPKPPVREQYVPVGPTGKITCTVGMYKGATFDIMDNEEIIIGRDPRAAQIVIGEGAQNVSRQHCKITYNASDNTYSVMDTSKNGTLSNATRQKLPHNVYTKVPTGTEIYLGDRSNMFRLG